MYHENITLVPAPLWPHVFGEHFHPKTPKGLIHLVLFLNTGECRSPERANEETEAQEGDAACRDDTPKGKQLIYGRQRAQGSCGFLHTWDPVMPQLCAGTGPVGGTGDMGRRRCPSQTQTARPSRQEHRQPQGELSCLCLTYL